MFFFGVGYFVVVDGKILVEDIVKFGMVLEVIDGDFDVDVKKVVKEVV